MVRKIAVAASLGNVKLRQVLNYEHKPYVNFATGLSIGGKIQIAKDLAILSEDDSYNVLATPQTFSTNVTVVDNGFGNKFVLNGISQNIPNLSVGNRYFFNQSDPTNDNNPLLLSKTFNGTHNGGTTYLDNVVYKLDNVTVDKADYISNFDSSKVLNLITLVFNKRGKSYL